MAGTEALIRQARLVLLPQGRTRPRRRTRRRDAATPRRRDAGTRPGTHMPGMLSVIWDAEGEKRSAKSAASRTVTAAVLRRFVSDYALSAHRACASCARTSWWRCGCRCVEGGRVKEWLRSSPRRPSRYCQPVAQALPRTLKVRAAALSRSAAASSKSGAASVRMATKTLPRLAAATSTPCSAPRVNSNR